MLPNVGFRVATGQRTGRFKAHHGQTQDEAKEAAGVRAAFAGRAEGGVVAAGAHEVDRSVDTHCPSVLVAGADAAVGVSGGGDTL